MLEGIYFANPNYLWLLLILPAVIAWHIVTWKKTQASLKVSSLSGFGKQNSFLSRLRPILFVFKTLALGLIILAIARPQTVDISTRTRTNKGIDIIMAIDVSSSMLAQDLKPDRLSALKRVASSFIDDRLSDRIGLVVYAGESYTKTPITSDKSIVKGALREIAYQGLIEDGTAIGMGLATSVNRLKDSTTESKIVILLTDGENNTGFIDPITAASIARENSIKAYTIGVGSYGSAPYPTKDMFGRSIYVDVPANIDEDIRDELLDDLNISDVVEAVTALETDDAVSVLKDLHLQRQKEVLEAIPEEERAAVEEGLTFPENSAGRLMQREVVALPAYWTIGKTIDHMREYKNLPDDFYEVIVVDPLHKPLGTIRLDKLLRTHRPVLLSNIMHHDIKTIPVMTDQEEVGYVFEQYDLISAPVVGTDGRLLGVVTVDDVVDVIQEEAEEDILRLSGVAETDIYRAALKTMWGRFTWLLVNLGTAILASFVIYQFDGTIDRMVALAVLMPIVASMGGNAGTQTMTVAVRAIATRDLNMANAGRVLGKEILVALANGGVFALLAGAAAGVWYSDYLLGLVIGGAMVINMITAGLFGLVIPIALWRLKIDPATAAGVLLTTVTDVVGFVAFLGLGAAILL